jgi:hypothetical protein
MTPRATAVLAIFVGPVVCATDQLVSYALVHRAAVRGSPAFFPGITALAASAVILLGLFLSWRVFRWQGDARGGEREGGVDRFLAVVGLAMNLFFLVVVVVGFGLPQVFLHPTD